MNKIAIAAWAVCAGLPGLGQAPVSLNIADVATAKLGFQGQFQFQSFTDPVVQGTSDNFVVRRLRFIAGGTIGSQFEWLFDTDQPKTGLVASNISGAKGYPSMYVQDAVLTWRPCKSFALDSGILTIDPNHNGLTSSARYFGNDASAYASLQNTPLGNSTAREVGLSGRGLLGDHVEYHLAVTNGLRVNGNDNPTTAPAAAVSSGTIAGNNALRLTGRVQYNLFDNEGAGYTAAGTYFGLKKIVSLGFGYDRQDAYSQATADVFVDLPLPGGDVVTFEGDYWRYNGGAFLPTLLKQKDWSAQLGYTFKSLNLSPIIRIESRRLDTPGDSKFGTPITTAAAWTTSNGSFDEDRQCIGLAYWIHSQRANLKVFYNNIQPKNLTGNGAVGPAGLGSGYKSFHQITAQLQLLAW